MNKKNPIVITLLVVLIAFVVYFVFKPKNSVNTSEIPTNQTTVANISGENLITKSDWGVSFMKTSDWDISNEANNEINIKQVPGEWAGDTISIDYISGQSITDTDAKFGTITYSYDESKGVWVEADNMDGEGTSPHPTPVPATATAYTADNIPVFSGTGRWKTFIIPLTHTTFLKLNISGSGDSQALVNLVKTLKKI